MGAAFAREFSLLVDALRPSSIKRQTRNTMKPVNLRSQLPVFGLFALATLAPVGASAQSRIAAANRRIAPITIPEAVSCTRCRITARSLAEIGEPDSPGELPGVPRMISRSRDGRYIVPVVGEPPFVYDSTGKYTGRLGSLGDGPGEFRTPRFVATGPGDTVFVYEAPSGRISVFAPDLRFVRTIPGVRSAQHFSVLQSGTLMVTGSLNSPDRIGLLYHLFDSRDERPRSIGEPAVQVVLRQPFDVFRKTAPARGDRFWAAHEFYNYRLEEWSADGRLHRILLPRSPWFPSYQLAIGEAPGRATPTKPALPDIWAIWTDSAGRIWVAARVADTASTGGFGPPVAVEGGQQYPIVAPERVWNTVIEVIDPDRARVVARATFSWAVLGWVDGNRVFSIRLTEDGGPVVDVWQLSLLSQ